MKSIFFVFVFAVNVFRKNALHDFHTAFSYAMIRQCMSIVCCKQMARAEDSKKRKREKEIESMSTRQYIC